MKQLKLISTISNVIFVFTLLSRSIFKLPDLFYGLGLGFCLGCSLVLFYAFKNCKNQGETDK